MDEDFALSDVGIALAEALAELEWARPELAAGVSIDLGPVPWDAVISYRHSIADLLAAAIEVVAGLLRDHAAELDTTDVLALTRVVHLVAAARELVNGKLAVTGRTHYGQLMHDAGQHILTASVALEGQRFANKAAAARATTVYVDVLHALGRHGRQLLGSDVQLMAVRAAGNADPRDAIAARLVDHLAHVGRRDLGTRKRNPPACGREHGSQRPSHRNRAHQRRAHETGLDESSCELLGEATERDMERRQPSTGARTAYGDHDLDDHAERKVTPGTPDDES